MSNIEDIKFIEEMIKEYKTFGDLHNPDYEDTDRIYKALENVLERIKELEEENRIYVLNGNNVKLELYIKENYIPVQKVKDKIEELKQKRKKEPQGTVRDFILVEEIKFLEELLEEK